MTRKGHSISVVTEAELEARQDYGLSEAPAAMDQGTSEERREDPKATGSLGLQDLGGGPVL